MRILFVLNFFIFLSIGVNSKETPDTLFYNDYWEMTSKQHASYYRVAKFNSNKMCFEGVVKDYFIDGKLQMVGHYSDCKRDGFFCIYEYKQRDSIIISFDNGARNGYWYEYGLNDRGYKKCKYKNNIEYVIEIRDSNGNMKVNGGNGSVYEERYYEPSRKNYYVKGKVKDSLRTGRWITYNTKGKRVKMERYKNKRVLNSRVLIRHNEYDIPFLAKDIYIIDVPSKLLTTEALEVERGVRIRQNQILIALQNHTKRERGILYRTNLIEGYDELEPFLDRKILFNFSEAHYYPEDDTIIVEFTHNTDYTISNIELIKPSYSEDLDAEIMNVYTPLR